MNKNYLENKVLLRSKCILYFSIKLVLKYPAVTQTNTYFVIGNVSKLLYSNGMVASFSLVH